METAIAKYTLTFSMLVGVAVVLKAALSVLGISKRMGGVVVKWMSLQLRISLQVKVLGGEEVLVREGSIVVWAGII